VKSGQDIQNEKMKAALFSQNGQDNNYVTQHPQLARFSKHEEMC